MTNLGEAQKQTTRGLKRKLDALEIRGNNCYNEWMDAFSKVYGLKAAIKRTRVTSHDDKRLMKRLKAKLRTSKIHEQECYALWVNAESLLDEGYDLVDESEGLDV